MPHRIARRVVALTAFAIAVPVAAQNSVSPWDPWIGCWDLVPRASQMSTDGTRVCVVPSADGGAVELVSIAGDSVTGRQQLQVGSGRRVQDGACTGVEDLHATGVRVYVRTSMECGGQRRLVNSVMAMSAIGEWIDVRGVAFGTNVGVKASRYRPAPSLARLPADVALALRQRSPLAAGSRIAASGRLQPADVIEAARYLEVGVLQTWLAERGQGFTLDANGLRALEKARVAPSVIDVMVALSYPAQFALDRTRLGDAAPDVRGDVRGEGNGADWYDDGYGYGYGYDPYGYGYGRGYGWYVGNRPIVVVQRPADSDDDEHGKVVKGRGYVSGRDGSSRSGGERSGDARGRAGSGSGDSGSDKGSSTGRKAKPKPSGP
ncbi:MAG: hypothetical protein IT361_04335 [Gemmatimonadaceae bacterium]|nr:hypothetical protein [Gemmatimonadaceae bacterium]